MKKNMTKYLCLMAALVCGLGLTLVSCKDDEVKGEPTKEQEQQMEDDLAREAEFWNVVGQLTDDIMPDKDWHNAIYDPTIGQPDGANDAVRIVSCADAESAAQRFADLVGLTADDGFDVNTQDYNYVNPYVGTLHYQKTGTGSLATVDVDIPQMPGLSQIIYKSPEQLEENGSFSGTAYYRFGDVVMKQNTDGQWDYWICVRPCFGPDSKGDSHWITLSKLPSDNIKPVPKRVNGVELTHILPKCLSTNQNHMQNLAELLYAMLEPDTWAAALQANSKLKFFVDMNYTKNYKYHNKFFFQNVANAWPDGLYRQLFGMTKDELHQEISLNGLNLIYNSASMSGNNIILPMAQFSGTNLKTKVLAKKTSTWTTENFNIYELAMKGFVEFKNFAGGNERAWLARYATGATLAKGSVETPIFDKYKRLPNCRDVFVYNIEVDNLNLDNLQNIPPKEAVAKADDAVATKALDDAGTYMIGDVVADSWDNRWICVAGSPKAPINPGVTDKTAYFISFDFNEVHTDGSRVEALPKENEVVEAAVLMGKFFMALGSIAPETSAGYNAGTHGHLGDVARHILTYADVDIRKIDVVVDSTWTFTSGGKTFHSISHSHIMNIAYDDGSFGRQAILRAIIDNTQAGTFRTACIGPSGKTYADWKFLYYKHYEDSRSPRMREATADEKSLGMNEWCLPWRMTTDKMYLQDVEDQDIVDKYAAKDKWVTLPLTTGNENVNNPRRKPRTKAESLVKPEDYIGKYDTDDRQKTNLFNEPVMFFRVMKVTDNGGKRPNLVSQDGRELHIIHIQNKADLYSGFSQALWAQPYNQGAETCHFVDNVQTPMPKTPGWMMP